MCNNDNSNECQCINEILKVILILQKNADCGTACLDTCDRGFLGCSISTVSCNTRPVMLYTCCGNGTPWSMPIEKEETSTTSSVFRIEKLDGCCATFRVLAPNPDTTQTSIPYVTTNSFFTMNLNCVCSIRCLSDTFVECI
ncbi:MAG: CotY/CotZ family spore coat protein [Clostridium sp.]|nr:CotY/CotZ family spore coat protein [Clostridium sp.]MCM1443890.1 CotY/CotZ family spore coat protein [Candidatus Amulumruptor caecigallinarius]